MRRVPRDELHLHREEAHPEELREARERAPGPLPARDATRLVPGVPAGGRAAEQRKSEGLQAAFSSIFPISSHSGNARLEFVSFSLLRRRSTSSSASSAAHLLLRAARTRAPDPDDKEAPKETVKEVKEQEVYMGEIPLMTTTARSSSTAPSA